eukprot:3823653-Karenia_brevis.AAC.1
MSSHAGSKEILKAMQWKERWRFVTVPEPSTLRLVTDEECELLGGLSPLGGSDLTDNSEQHQAHGSGFVDTRVRAAFRTPSRSTAYRDWLLSKLDDRTVSSALSIHGGRLHRSRGSPPLQRPTVEVSSNVAIPDVDRSWWISSRWNTLYEKEWRWPQEHINVKEARVCLQSLRRHSRSAWAHNKRILDFSDNMVSICSFERGRSKSHALNALCRRSAAYRLGCRIQWRLRHVRSALNPADEGSRRMTHLNKGMSSPVAAGSGEFKVFLHLFAGSDGLSAQFRARNLLIHSAADIPMDERRQGMGGPPRHTLQHLVMCPKGGHKH